MSYYNRIDVKEIEGKCPVCYEVDIKTSHQYQSHVGNHLEQLALFALPSIDEGDDSNEQMDHPSAKGESEEEYSDNEINETTGKSGHEEDSAHPIGTASEISPPDASTKPGCLVKDRKMEKALLAKDTNTTKIWYCVSFTSSQYLSFLVLLLTCSLLS